MSPTRHNTMYLADHAHKTSRAATQPAREEDPFSLDLYETFAPLHDKVRRERGNDVRIAIAIGNCFGGWTFCDPQTRILRDRGPGKVSAFLSVAWFPAAAQGRITIKRQLKVPALTFSAEFHAFYDALATCQFWLEHRVCDVAFAGAAETVGSPFMSTAFGASATHDAAAWFVLAREGTDEIRLHPGVPPADMQSASVPGDAFQGTPIRGACALPLLALEARRRPHEALRVPGRGVVRSAPGALDLWRRDFA